MEWVVRMIFAFSLDYSCTLWEEIMGAVLPFQIDWGGSHLLSHYDIVFFIGMPNCRIRTLILSMDFGLYKKNVS